MKKTILLAGCLFSLLFTNCSKEDDPEQEANLLSVAQSTAEETPISIATLENGISISGATLKTGVLTPNEQTSFTIDETELSGFQDVGFELNLNVPSDYAGAYIQLLDADGNPSENYFDVPLSNYYYYKSFSEKGSGFKKIAKPKSNKTSVTSAKVLEDVPENTTTISVDFDETVPAGSFCYYICIYDDAGNISAPIEVCVEVEEWGGNPNLVGNWVFEKLVETYDGETNTIELNVKDYDTFTQTCYSNDTPFDIEEYWLIKSFLFNLNSDGTQSYTTETESSSLDWDEFYYNCMVSYNFNTEQGEATGNWAYDEEEEKLTLVDYNYSFKTYDENGELIYDDIEIEVAIGFDLYVTKLTSTELVLEIRYDDLYYNYDEQTGEYTVEEVEDVYTYYFKR